MSAYPSDYRNINVSGGNPHFGHIFINVQSEEEAMDVIDELEEHLDYVTDEEDQRVIEMNLAIARMALEEYTRHRENDMYYNTNKNNSSLANFVAGGAAAGITAGLTLGGTLGSIKVMESYYASKAEASKKQATKANDAPPSSQEVAKARTQLKAQEPVLSNLSKAGRTSAD